MSIFNAPVVQVLPQELKLGELDYEIPRSASSRTIKVFPYQNQSITYSGLSLVLGANASADIAIPQQNIDWVLPTSQSPSTFLDTRLTTLNYRMTITSTTAVTQALTFAYLRSSAYSWFDYLQVRGGSGQLLDDIPEYGVVADTLINCQMSNSDRDGLSVMYGFDGGSGITSQGLPLPLLTSAFTAGTTETHSFSIPLISNSIGVCSDRFLNIGNLKNLTMRLVTPTTLPLTITNGGTANTAGAFTITLSDISLTMELVDIGNDAYQELVSTAHDNKFYSHGITYKTTNVLIPAGTVGSFTPSVSVNGSSVKSIFTRFWDLGAVSTANSVNHKYDSKLPSLSALQWNFSSYGKKPDCGPLNPLLRPSECFRNLMVAMGQFNSSQFNSSITPVRYTMLCAGGVQSAYTSTTQDALWTTGSISSGLSSFFYGENLEKIPRRGVLSGLDMTSCRANLEMVIATANTNNVIAWVISMNDVILCHDLNTHDIYAL